MKARRFPIGQLAARCLALASLAVVAACDMAPLSMSNANAPLLDTSRPAKVALLVPGGSADPGDTILARDLENAARMAVADLGDVKLDLAVYNTAGQPAQAAAMAQQAAAEGANIILGPLHREAAVSASRAVAAKGVNVLSFSNTSSIAGGNLFLLGALYETKANRLIGYAKSQGISRYYIAAAQGPAGALGRQAIVDAVAGAGAQVVGTTTYPLSQQDIIAATTEIAAQARAAGAQAIITTAQPGAELSILATLLPEKGVTPPEVRFIGLTRWNASPEMLQVPGLQGGYFALPKMERVQSFEQRYESTYGSRPHPLAGLAYDGIAAIGALAATQSPDAFSGRSLTRSAGYQGTTGVFRFLPSGRNQRGLAVATVNGGRVEIIDPAPTSFGNVFN